MNVWLALRRLLPLLAVLSLALTPVAAAASAAGTGMMASMTVQAGPAGHPHDMAMAMGQTDTDQADMADGAMDDMPCCPKAKPETPGCAKGCPLVALCFATVASLLPAAVALPVPVVTRASRSWPATAFFASVHGRLLPEPPRA